MAKKKTSRKTAPSASKKKAATKKSARKAPIKKKVAKKPAAKKPVTKKSTTKKPTAKKAPPKKVAKKPATKKSVTKKITKKPAAKKPTTKKAPLKKSTTKKSTTKKPTTKKKPAASSSKKTPAVPVKKPAAIKPLFGAWDASATKKSQAAAAKLAAAAGLAPVQAATATKDTGDKNTKRLTKSPLTKKQLRDFRELLIRKRRVILGDVNAIESEALTGSDSGASSRLPQHMADAGSDTYDQSLALDLVASQREMLKKIDAAIEKIDNNTYGICEALGVPINLERLEATPWAHLSIDAARQEERAAHP